MDLVVGSTVLDMDTVMESKTIEVDQPGFGKRYQVFGRTDRD